MNSVSSGLVHSGLNIIYARSANHCIGANGGLPWRLPLEYQHFENMTRGFPMIMGRRSYQDHNGLLPGGTNIIVSRQSNLQIEQEAILAPSLERAIKIAREIRSSYFVIGGAGLIAESLPQANAVFESVIHTDVSGDTFLPEFEFSSWQTKTLFSHERDAEHPFSFTAYQHTRLA